MVSEHNLVALSTMMLLLSLNLFGTGSELEFSRAAPKMSSPDDDAVASASNRKEYRFADMMLRRRCLLFDSPANLSSTWTGTYLLSVFMVGSSLSSQPSRSDIQHLSSLSEDLRAKLNDNCMWRV